MRLPWQLFPFVQNFHVWSLFTCFCRVSNHEKKLEAVRSGVRAISVSGKMEIVLSTSSFSRPPSSVVPSTVFSVSSVFLCHLLFSSCRYYSFLTYFVCMLLFRHPSFSSTLIHSRFFPLSNARRLLPIGCRPNDIDTS